MQTPYLVADETFVLPSYVIVPGFACLNPMLIRGSEPILVDVSSPVSPWRAHSLRGREAIDFLVLRDSR
jgi:hypothetical protein